MKKLGKLALLPRMYHATVGATGLNEGTHLDFASNEVVKLGFGPRGAATPGRGGCRSRPRAGRGWIAGMEMGDREERRGKT